MKTLKLALGLIPVLFANGCSHLGADRLIDSRFNYTAAIGESWKTQMLLNVVKLRYGDTPIFLNVQSVIDQVSLSSGLSLNGNWTDLAPWSGGFGGNTQYTTSPTVTYAPMGGAKFGKQMMTSIPTTSIVNLLQSGYSAKVVLRLTVNSINGRQNHFQGDDTAMDSGFYRVLELISALQADNSIGLRVKSVEGKDTVVLSLHEPKDTNSRAQLDEFRRLLDLDENTLDFTVVYGVLPTNRQEIAILTRSVIDVLSDLSGTIEVPAKHVAETRAMPSKLITHVEGRTIKPLMIIHTGASKPDDAAVAVPYHDYWYWINDRDFASKSTFSFLMFVMNLANSGENNETPSIVVPTGRAGR